MYAVVKIWKYPSFTFNLFHKNVLCLLYCKKRSCVALRPRHVRWAFKPNATLIPINSQTLLNRCLFYEHALIEPSYSEGSRTYQYPPTFLQLPGTDRVVILGYLVLQSNTCRLKKIGYSTERALTDRYIFVTAKLSISTFQFFNKKRI